MLSCRNSDEFHGSDRNNMVQMTESEAIAFYHSLQRFGIQPGLERISLLCKKLGDPQKHLCFVHVAGTNGKGTTCTEIASVLTAAGYKTGLFTSPYVLRFHERIQIDGTQISGEALVAATEKVKVAVEVLNSQGVYPTEFEAITAAAFLFYFNEGCDLVVLEVGLGGRFDATNVIADPEVCVITSISLDHTAVLGDTLEAIAAEKSGIIKTGSTVVTAASQPSGALDVIRKTARERGAELHVVSSDQLFAEERGSIFGWEVQWNGGMLHIPFGGAHQLENASLAIEACILLRKKGYSISDSAVRKGIASAFLPARTEILSKDPLVILDGSHNEGSTRALADFIRTRLGGKRILAVMGMMADKDSASILGHVLPLVDSVIAVKPSNPRAMDAEMLCNCIKNQNISCIFFEDVFLGIDKAVSDLYDNYEVLLVCGSLYLAADCRAYLQKRLAEVSRGKNRPENSLNQHV